MQKKRTKNFPDFSNNVKRNTFKSKKLKNAKVFQINLLKVDIYFTTKE